MSRSNKSEDMIIEVKNLKKWFPLTSGFEHLISRKEIYLKAVDGVTFNIKRGEIIALAGESGCGKTTTGRTIMRLTDPTSGTIKFGNVDISRLRGKELIPYRSRMQMIFQDPYDAVNPRMKIYNILKEPLKFYKLVKNHQEERTKIIEILELVKLTPPEAFLEKFPRSLSGGELQRVCIARAMILNPEFIVTDEPVSMLDVSIRAGILNFFLDLKDKFRTSILFISHDLAMSSYVADRMMIMYMGKLFEEGSTKCITTNPLNPYTKALIASVPNPDPTKKPRRASLKGEPSSPINLSIGCRLHPRCPHAMDICRKEDPDLIEVEKNQKVACFLYS